MKNAKILIVPINYNTYSSLTSLINSIDESLKQCNTEISVDIHIADNSTIIEDFSYHTQYINSLKLKRNGNVGYFGGAAKVLNEIDSPQLYDFVIISNVDVKVDSTFFQNLVKQQLNEKVGWIAPQIWSHKESRDRNPKISQRYSKNKIGLIKLLWQFPILHKIYVKTLYRRKSITQSFFGEGIEEIYAGHGSFIILTKAFISRYPSIEYPIFLFGEELYLAELCRKANLSVLYNPVIKVLDTDHISTSKLKSRSFYRYNFEAIKYIINNFYE